MSMHIKTFSSSKYHATLYRLAVLVFFSISTAADAQSYNLSVNVSGLTDSTVTFYDSPVIEFSDQFLVVRNGTDAIEIHDNGKFLVSGGLESGTAYSIEVSNQPYLNSQTCNPAGSEVGVIENDSVVIDITCAPSPTFKISGEVAGLRDGAVEIVNNAGEELFLNGNGSFQFNATEYFSGYGYAVFVMQNPFNQNCVVRNSHGIINQSDISGISIVCEDRTTEPRASICVGNGADLQDALSEASDNGIDTEIKVVEGFYPGPFYYFSRQENGLHLEGGHDPGCGSKIAKPDNTILDGDGLFRTLSLRSQGDITVRHLTIQNGYHKNFRRNDDGILAPDFSGIGGGLRAAVFGNKELVVESSIIQNNIAHTDGGGASLVLTEGVIRLTNNIFRNNLACPRCPIKLLVTIDGEQRESGFGPSGGGMWFLINDGRADLVNNTFFENIALSGFGGGVRISMSADGHESYARLFNNIFFENLAADEGNDVWMQFDQGADFEPQFPPVLRNNRFGPREPEDVFADFQFDFNFSENPQFSNPGAGDLRLKEESPLVDGGLTPAPQSGAQAKAALMSTQSSSDASISQEILELPSDVVLPETDISGSPRITGSAVDVGAFEQEGLIFASGFEAAGS